MKTTAEDRKRWKEYFGTNESAITLLVDDIEELLAKCDNPHQELTMQELTDRFYLVRRQRDQLIACIQKVQRITWDTERGSEEKSHDILKACEEASNFVLFFKHQAPDVVQGEGVGK